MFGLKKKQLKSVAAGLWVYQPLVSVAQCYKVLVAGGDAWERGC